MLAHGSSSFSHAPNLSWQLKERETWTPSRCQLFSTSSENRGSPRLSILLKVEATGWKDCRHGQIPAKMSLALDPELSLTLSKNLTLHQWLAESFGLIKLIRHCLDMVYPSTSNSHPPNLPSLFLVLSFTYQKVIGLGEGWNVPCLLCVSRSKVQQYPLINPPTWETGLGITFGVL